MPPVEAWKKVLITLKKDTTVAQHDPHLALMSCVRCHGGDASELDDHHAAHEGLIVDPSASEVDQCRGCHEAIADSYRTSMHATLQGEKNAIAARVGVASFSECPQKMQDGFKGECASCHATCGDCHVSRPDSAGKGFIKSHQFQRTPHQKYQCMACHGSRIEHDFVGDSEAGRPPDVHFGKGLDCMSCHSGDEMHQAAGDAPDRYHLARAPRCEDCHRDAESNEHHQAHWDDLSCHVCHAQPYSSCTACHTGGGWKTDPAYQENNPWESFKIGLNPFEDRRYKYVTLRHAPVAPDSYDAWGEVDALKDFAALPTWKHATPHSVRRWTDRTVVPEGASCAASCHMGDPGGGPENAAHYLFTSDVEGVGTEYVEANQGVVVDEHLPQGWR